jgi:hypothetical protein
METNNAETLVMEAAPFDAVQMMRDIRDQISLETADMTFLQLKEYMQKKLNEQESNAPNHAANCA